jgi:hypothetical protein
MTNATDQNEELEANDIEDETSSDEGTSSEEPEEQSIEEESGEADEQVSISKSELDKLKREAFAAKRLRDRKGKGEDSAEGSQEASQGFDKEMIERTFIAVHAKIEDTEVQDEALRLARKFGMSVPDAVKDPDIKLRLENMQKQKKARQAIAGQTGSAKNNNRGIDYHVEQYKMKGVLPSDPATIAKVLERLAN